MPELLIGIGTAGAELQATVRQLVEHGRALGDVDRMVRGQDRDAEADPDPLGELTQRAEQDLGAGRAREPGEEVVLDEPEVVEPDPVREHALLDRLLVERVPVDAGALERSLRFVEQAESHGRLSSPRMTYPPCIVRTADPTATSISVRASTSWGVNPGATSSRTKRLRSQRSSARSVTT